MTRLPTLFLSHGSPMHAVDAGGAGQAWRALAASLPKPRAILIASAHWETALPMLTGAGKLETIHDFAGFPAELYKIRYDAPGSPDLANEAAALLRAADMTPSVNACRGLDHGAWVPLKWMYPERDVPVVQLSVQPHLGTSHHLALGRALAPLAERDVLVIGSGHVTHNLRDWSTSRGASTTLPYVTQFAGWLAQKLEARDVEAVLGYRDQAPGAERAHPTDEHFLPLFVALGAAGPAPVAEKVYDATEGAALAMDAYRFTQAA
ncbi:MAG TPA: class III extradiol ring-cleavage dioxygenase [Steroidobacteraceae bacterium]